MKNTKPYARQKHAVVAVDAVIFGIVDDRLHVSLMQTNKKEFKNLWALPGGLIRTDEDLDAAVHRVVREKTGIEGLFLDQLATFGEVDRDPFGRVVSVAYLSLVNADHVVLSKTERNETVQWFDTNATLKLAYDHSEILSVGLNRLKSKLHYSDIAKGLLPETFTLTQLQKIYEIILRKELDKRNFRKKILSLDIVKTTGKKQSGLQARPAELYRFTRKNVQYIDIF